MDFVHSVLHDYTRVGSSLNLNPHAHSLVLDGIFNVKNNTFHGAPVLQDEDVKDIVEVTAYRVIRLLRKRGIIDGSDLDSFAEEQPDRFA